MEATLKRIESRDPPGQHKTPVEFLRAALIEAQKQVLAFRHQWRKDFVVKSVAMHRKLPRVCGRVRWSVPVSVPGLDRKSKYRAHTVVRMNQDVGTKRLELSCVVEARAVVDPLSGGHGMKR